LLLDQLNGMPLNERNSQKGEFLPLPSARHSHDHINVVKDKLAFTIKTTDERRACRGILEPVLQPRHHGSDVRNEVWWCRGLVKRTPFYKRKCNRCFILS
jgi:hypothetical protein